MVPRAYYKILQLFFHLQAPLHHRSSIDFTNFYQIFFLYCLFFICSEGPIDPLSDDFQQVQLHPDDEIEDIINKGPRIPFKNVGQNPSSK